MSLETIGKTFSVPFCPASERAQDEKVGNAGVYGNTIFTIAPSLPHDEIAAR